MAKNCAFISYRSDNGFVYADLLYGYLERDNIPCFWDKAKMQNFTGAFPEELRRQIDDADDFILILSPQCLDASGGRETVFVREIRYAQERDKKIIPIFCGSFSFPASLPQGLERLPELSRLSWTDSGEKLYRSLLERMTKTEPVTSALDRNYVFTKLEHRGTIEAAHPFSERITDDVTGVDLCAICGQGFLIYCREYINQLARQKCQMRFVTTRPNCAAAKEAVTYKLTSGPMEIKAQSIPNAWRAMKSWKVTYPELIQCRTTNLYLPFAIFIIRHADSRRNTIKVDYYSFESGDVERRSVLIPYGDRDNYDFYCKQFEWVWDHSAPIE